MNNEDPVQQSEGELEQAREFEQALARSLRRVDAPADLMTRVLARAEAEEAGNRKQSNRKQKAGDGEARDGEAGDGEAGSRRRWSWVAPAWGWKPAWGAMAAILVAGVLGGHAVQEHRLESKHRARVQASREFDVSVQITDQALDRAREQLRRKGVSLDGE